MKIFAKIVIARLVLFKEEVNILLKKYINGH